MLRRGKQSRMQQMPGILQRCVLIPINSAKVLFPSRDADLFNAVPIQFGVKILILQPADNPVDNDFVKGLNKFIREDVDGYSFIDVLDQIQEFNDPEFEYVDWMNELRELIFEGLKSTDQSVRMKFQWLRTYYNDVVKDRISFRITYDVYTKYKESINDMINAGFSFSIILDESYDENLQVLDLFACTFVYEKFDYLCETCKNWNVFCEKKIKNQNKN